MKYWLPAVLAIYAGSSMGRTAGWEKILDLSVLTICAAYLGWIVVDWVLQ